MNKWSRARNSFWEEFYFFSALIGSALFLSYLIGAFWVKDTMPPGAGQADLIATSIFLGCMATGVAVAVVITITYIFWAVYDRIGKWYYGLDNIIPNNTNTTIKPKQPIIKGRLSKVYNYTGTVSTLLAGERRSAPRAKFFGRLNGDSIDKEGHFEEKWLNHWEEAYWHKQKDYKEALAAGIVDERPIGEDKMIKTETKIIK